MPRRVFNSSLLETTSWGFVHRPNQEGSPFGAAGYRLRRLGDGWYWFVADDDWF